MIGRTAAISTTAPPPRFALPGRQRIEDVPVHAPDPSSGGPLAGGTPRRPARRSTLGPGVGEVGRRLRRGRGVGVEATSRPRAAATGRPSGGTRGPVRRGRGRMGGAHRRPPRGGGPALTARPADAPDRAATGRGPTPRVGQGRRRQRPRRRGARGRAGNIVGRPSVATARTGRRASRSTATSAAGRRVAGGGEPTRPSWGQPRRKVARKATMPRLPVGKAAASWPAPGRPPPGA